MRHVKGYVNTVKSIALAFIGISILLAASPSLCQVKAQRTLLDQTKKPVETIHPAVAMTNNNGDSVSNSPFSIGTMAGVSVAIGDLGKYRVNSDRTITQYDKDSRVAPAVFALPSLALKNIWNRPLEAILPIGMQGRDVGDVAAGLGLAWGDFGKGQSSNVGVAIAWVVSGRENLTTEQRSAFNNGTPLSPGASTDISKVISHQIVIGIYVAPKL